MPNSNAMLVTCVRGHSSRQAPTIVPASTAEVELPSSARVSGVLPSLPHQRLARSWSPPPDRKMRSLMRSRYSAYALGLADYLLATWHASTRPAAIEPDLPDLKWLGLAVRRHAQQGEAHATVEFVARIRLPGGCAQRLQETSRFVREDGRWFYVDGDIALG